MEDLTMSLKVGLRWRLANARRARIFHDHLPGTYKSDPAALARMELVNRHYVMTEILHRRRLSDYWNLFVWEIFQLGSCAARGKPTLLGQMTIGKWQAARAIATGKRS